MKAVISTAPTTSAIACVRKIVSSPMRMGWES